MDAPPCPLVHCMCLWCIVAVLMLVLTTVPRLQHGYKATATRPRLRPRNGTYVHGYAPQVDKHTSGSCSIQTLMLGSFRAVCVTWAVLRMILSPVHVRHGGGSCECRDGYSGGMLLAWSMSVPSTVLRLSSRRLVFTLQCSAVPVLQITCNVPNANVSINVQGPGPRHQHV